MGNYYDSLTKMYSVTKTIRQELIPVGKTLENIKAKSILDADIKRKADYAKVKVLMDDFHKKIIENSLSDIKLSGLDEVEKLYAIKNKSEGDKQRLDTILASLREEIANALKENEDYNVAFSKDLIELKLPEIVSDEDKDAIESFRRFTTYFTDYNKNRLNLYSSDEKHSTVAYRCINENLFIFLANISIYKLIKSVALNIEDYTEEEVDKTFMIDNFNDCLTQNGIEKYNSVVASIKTVVNLYTQQHNEDSNFVKIPKMKMLHKQILSDRTSLFEGFVVENDGALIDNIESFDSTIIEFVNNEFGKFVNALLESQGEGVFVKNDSALSALSVITTGSWSAVKNAFNDEFDANYTGKLNEKYEEKREKEFKKNDSFEVSKIAGLLNVDVIGKYIEKINEDIANINEFSILFREKVLKQHDKNKKLQKNNEAVAAIKCYLDSIKELERDIKLLNGTSLENRNEFFYGEQEAVLNEIAIVDDLYNMTRNYLTQKPFSTEKTKLNFNNPQLLGGWDVNKEKDCYGVLLLRGNKYYLAIMDKSSNKSFVDMKDAECEDSYKKVNCKLLPGPNKMFPKVFFSGKSIDFFDSTREMKTLYDRGTFKKGKNFNLEDCHKLIDFYKESVNKHDEWKNFNFQFSDTNSYEDISGFFREVEAQNYKISFTNIDAQYIETLVDEGKLYLFEIYNKDFSEHSTGNLNLHTLYLTMLFNEENLKDVVVKLNGEAEVFYRPASIKDEDRVIHKANEKIKAKNPDSANKDSLFVYDIIKDRRYTKDKFFLHLPITLNYKETGVFQYNTVINNAIKDNANVRTIGIDRGERNLLYVVVCDTDGSILYQKSLNEIISEGKKTNYQKLLDDKEKNRLAARRDWKSIENIKELKQGYLSQVVNVIYKLIIEYNAVVVLEDLNIGFKNSRKKVEKQVYQNFEKALIDKLNYLCLDKSREQTDPTAKGNVLNAYQLTAKFESFEKIGKQTGCIFYVPAYLTSQIDPTTGFCNLFYAKYTSKEEARKFFGKFDSIKFDKEFNDFKFVFDYSNFTYKADGTKTNWIISSQGSRIERRREESANGNYISNTVYPTEILRSVLETEGINYTDGHD